MMKRRTMLFTTILLLLSGTASYVQAAPKTPPASDTASPAVKSSPAQEPELLRGVANYREGNYEEAYDDLVKARDKAPDSSVAAYYLGATLKKLQQFGKAVPHLRAAVTLQPPVNQAYLELADAYYAEGSTEAALKALESCEQEGVEPGQTSLLKGLVQMKKNKYRDAASSFEKAKSLDASLAPSADFQLAVIYDRSGETGKARDLFLQVANADGESDIGMMARQQAEALTSRMESKKAFHATADLQYQYDSNVVLMPDGSVSSISGKSDSAAVAAVRAEYEPELSAPYGLKLDYSFYASLYQKLRTYDVQNHTVGVTPTYRIGQNLASIDVNGSFMLVDNKKYYQALSLSPEYLFVTGENQYTKVLLRFQQNDYLYPLDSSMTDENRDGYDTAAGFSWYKLIAAQKGYLNVKYELNKEKTKGRNWSYLGNKAFAGALFPATDRMKFSAGLEAYFQNYDNARQDPSSQVDVKRRDTIYTASLDGLYAITANIDLHAQYVYVQADSTESIYKYHKNVVGAGVYVKF